ncbi:MAG: UbiA family prenyltransferase [Candidatus Aenigmatarchaeota archaeon]
MGMLKKLRALVYDPLYIGRNSLIFVFGAVLFYVVTGAMSRMSLVGLLGFVMAYNSVYYLNDLKDYEEDKKDPVKWKTKPLLNGSMTKKEMVATYAFYLVVGLAVSFYVGALFGSLVALMLVLNLLHSFLFKKVYFLLFSNMIIIQSLKMTLGWMSAAQSFDSFPWFFVLFSGCVYSLGYLVYKKERKLVEVNREKFRMGRLEYMRYGIKKIFRTLLREPINAFFLMLTLAMYLLSYVLYSFRLHLLMMIAVSVLMSVSLKHVKGEKLNLYATYHVIIDMLYASIIITFYLCSTLPELVALNALL